MREILFRSRTVQEALLYYQQMEGNHKRLHLSKQRQKTTLPCSRLSVLAYIVFIFFKIFSFLQGMPARRTKGKVPRTKIAMQGGEVEEALRDSIPIYQVSMEFCKVAWELWELEFHTRRMPCW